MRYPDVLTVDGGGKHVLVVFNQSCSGNETKKRLNERTTTSYLNELKWEKLVKFTDVCLVFKMFYGTASPPLSDFIKQRTQSGRHTRSASRGDCIISYRSSSFKKSAFSVN